MGIDEEQQASGFLEWLGKKEHDLYYIVKKLHLDLEATLGKSDDLRSAYGTRLQKRYRGQYELTRATEAKAKDWIE